MKEIITKVFKKIYYFFGIWWHYWKMHNENHKNDQ